MKRSIMSILFLIVGVISPSLTKILAAPGDCGTYLSVSVNNIASGLNLVVLWTTDSSPTDVVLSRDFFNGGARANVASEIFPHLEGVGSKEFIANAQGFSEHYVLSSTYPDGTTQTTTCVVTVNSPQAAQPQVVNFTVFGRNATTPGSTHQIGWETRNVNQVQLLAMNPNNQQVISKTNLPASGSVDITIPADYTFTTLQLILQLDQIPVKNLPIAAFLNLPINLSTQGVPPSQPSGSQPPASQPSGSQPSGSTTASTATIKLVDWRPVGEATYQEFEKGIMLWLPGVVQQPVVIMYNDGTWQFGQWQEVATTITEKPPTALFAPVAGNAFGKVWAQDNLVRSKLGWGTNKEISAPIKVRVYGSVWLIQMPDGTIRIGQDLSGTQSWAVVK